jgi:adenosylcobyric acid synthase
MTPNKRLSRVEAVEIASGLTLSGYEIHIGRTEGPDRARPLFRIGSEPEGAASPDGRVEGAYLHGLFTSDAYRAGFLGRLGADASGQGYDVAVEETLDALAAHLEAHCDLDGLLRVSRSD